MRIHHLDCGTGCPVGGWRLYVGDVCVYRRGMRRRGRRRCTPGLTGSQRQMEVDADARMNIPQRLRALSMERASEATTTCAHNPIELERCHARRPL